MCAGRARAPFAAVKASNGSNESACGDAVSTTLTTTLLVDRQLRGCSELEVLERASGASSEVLRAM